MDKFIEVFLDPLKLLKPPWNYLAGIVALLLVVGPRLMEFRSSWLELRWGREELEREKLRLEVLKLRIDLRQLAEQHNLPEIARELEGVTVSPPSIVVPSPPPPPPPERARVLVRFFAGHPRVGWFVMLIAQIFLGYFAISFAVAAVGSPILGWTGIEPDFGLGLSIFAAIVYAALAWLSWKGFSVTRSIRKELAAR
jgi:hypothetical protein